VEKRSGGIVIVNEELNDKDAICDSGWAVVTKDCEYEAWTTENRFRRVYHLAPCEEIVVQDLKNAQELASQKNGIVTPINITK
jgi:hypothetical protein